MSIIGDKKLGLVPVTPSIVNSLAALEVEDAVYRGQHLFQVMRDVNQTHIGPLTNPFYQTQHLSTMYKIQALARFVQNQ